MCRINKTQNLSQGFFLFRLSLFFVLLLACAHICLADVHFASGDRALNIPFKLKNNHIYLQTTVNNSKPLWFLLDTGAVNILHRRNAELLNMKLYPKGQVGGVGATSVSLWSTENVSFSFPGVEYYTPQISVISLEGVEGCAGRTSFDENGNISVVEEVAKSEEKLPIDGLLGYQFFNSFVVEIDYESQVINLYDPKKYQYEGNGEVIPIEFSGAHIFMRAPLTAQNGGFPNSRFLIDTGAAPALILNTPFVVINKLLPPPDQTKTLEICGVGGKTRTQIGTIKSLQLNNQMLENPVTLFSQATAGVLTRRDFDGIIGNAVWRRFRVIFDYRRERMILESVSSRKS